MLKLLYTSLIILLSGCGDNHRKKENLNQQSSTDDSRQQVIVAIADACQEPLAFEDGKGISNDIISALNKVQEKYHFSHELVPTKRMKQLSRDGKVNMVAFTNKAWGWDSSLIKESAFQIQDRDVFFALKDGRNKSFFNNLESRSIVGVKGFHYKFKKPHSYIEVQNEKAVVNMVVEKRGEIGIVSILTLEFLAVKDPELYSKLIISDYFDSKYTRSYLVINNGPINVEELDTLLENLKKKGSLKSIFAKYGLQKSLP